MRTLDAFRIVKLIEMLVALADFDLFFIHIVRVHFLLFQNFRVEELRNTFSEVVQVFSLYLSAELCIFLANLFPAVAF